MLHWLVRLWHKFTERVMPHPAESTHRFPASRPYQPSNLHSRHH
jgi:hypothetical protein